jgi:hypothetical protein
MMPEVSTQIDQLGNLLMIHSVLKSGHQLNVSQTETYTQP